MNEPGECPVDSSDGLPDRPKELGGRRLLADGTALDPAQKSRHPFTVVGVNGFAGDQSGGVGGEPGGCNVLEGGVLHVEVSGRCIGRVDLEHEVPAVVVDHERVVVDLAVEAITS